jgi:hypothetical protein
MECEADAEREQQHDNDGQCQILHRGTSALCCGAAWLRAVSSMVGICSSCAQRRHGVLTHAEEIVASN